jgi:LPXTG-motif cell wall-anchored protein
MYQCPGFANVLQSASIIDHIKEYRMFRKLIVGSLLALLAALALVPSAFAQGSNAKVRVVHASPDAPAVDVYVNGNLTLNNVPFFTASDYLDLPAGSYQIQVTPTGQPASAAVIDATATVEAGKAYTIAATGEVANIQATIVADDLTPPAAGKAKVKVYHFSPDAPAVDVKLADGTALISNLAFPDASDYLEVDAGSYDLQVTPNGDSTVVIDLAGTALEAGNIYSVFATNVVASITPEVAVTAAPAVATTLPATGAGDQAPFIGLALAACVMLVLGGYVLRRRAM